MNELLQTKKITTNVYVNEINKNIDNSNYLSALTLALMLPDICSKNVNDNKGIGYVKWFNKYVYRTYYDIPNSKQIKKVPQKLRKIYKVKFNGTTCYALRNAVLHSGTSFVNYKKDNDRIKANVDHIELCVNSKSERDFQYGESVSIITDNYDETKVTIRINVVNFCMTMINGYYDFLKDIEKNDIQLFYMIDWDNK